MKKSLALKQYTHLALASTIGFSMLGTSTVIAAEKVNFEGVNQSIKYEDITIEQLLTQMQANNVFISHVKFFINKHFNESNFLWSKVSKPLKRNIVDLLLGSEKDYSRKLQKIISQHYVEALSLLKQASKPFMKDFIQLLNYIPK
ncbi:hypothetical protein ACQKIW_30940 [Bacillus thuringiensis]|uniref:hypothetical protein n=1 Tax=Bacillus thuringiensis TaxID=1428 RepID=UPI003D002DED